MYVLLFFTHALFYGIFVKSNLNFTFFIVSFAYEKPDINWSNGQNW